MTRRALAEDLVEDEHCVEPVEGRRVKVQYLSGKASQTCEVIHINKNTLRLTRTL